MMPHLVSYVLTAAAPAWQPKTAEDVRRWVREANEMNARERARADADHRRRIAEQAAITRQLQVEAERRQRERRTAPPKRPVAGALDVRTIYAERNKRAGATLPASRSELCADACFVAGDGLCDGATTCWAKRLGAAAAIEAKRAHRPEPFSAVAHYRRGGAR